MKREFAPAVRKEFTRALAEAWPQFQIVTGATTPAGWRLFSWKADTDFWLFLLLGFPRQSNEFKIELGWSNDDRYPDEFFPPSAPDPSLVRSRCEIMVATEYAGFKNRLWKVGSNPSYHPEVVVPAAIAEMKAFAAPIMNQVLSWHGKGTSSQTHPV